MIFWRKKNNPSVQEQQDREEKLVHRPTDPAIEPPTDYDPQINEELAHELNETEVEVIEDLGAQPLFVPEAPGHTDDDVNDADQGGWLSRLASGLTKSSAKIGQGLADLMTKHKLDQTALDGLEELLITADLGPATAQKIIKSFSESQLVGRDTTDEEIRTELAHKIADILQPCAQPLVIKKPANGPFVILVCGVNGVGKTTTIGKLAKVMHDQKHHKVMMVAGDTFRAAAVEQLQIWGTRAHCPVVTRDIGADAAALAFEAYEQAKRDGIEVMLIDTAGRLHNKANLMAELEKIVRVLKKHDADLPHEVLLVLDGTTGQNAYAQVETFKEMVNVSGLVVTKLDGSAKGGVVVGLADKFGLPIYAVGVGEGADDLQPFTAAGYARGLLGLE